MSSILCAVSNWAVYHSVEVQAFSETVLGWFEDQRALPCVINSLPFLFRWDSGKTEKRQRSAPMRSAPRLRATPTPAGVTPCTLRFAPGWWVCVQLVSLQLSLLLFIPHWEGEPSGEGPPWGWLRFHGHCMQSPLVLLCSWRACPNIICLSLLSPRLPSPVWGPPTYTGVCAVLCFLFLLWRQALLYLSLASNPSSCYWQPGTSEAPASASWVLGVEVWNAISGSI